MLRLLSGISAGAVACVWAASAQLPSPEAYCGDWYRAGTRAHRECLVERRKELQPPAALSTLPPPPAIEPEIARAQEKCRSIVNQDRRIRCAAGEYRLADEPDPGRWDVWTTVDRLDDSVRAYASLNSFAISAPGASLGAKAFASINVSCRGQVLLAFDPSITRTFALRGETPVAYRIDAATAVRVSRAHADPAAIALSPEDSSKFIEALKSAKSTIFLRVIDGAERRIDVDFADVTGLAVAMDQMRALCDSQK